MFTLEQYSLMQVYYPFSGRWPISLPGINSGLPFRLIFKRHQRSGSQSIEPLSQEFILDLFLRNVSIEVPVPLFWSKLALHIASY
jgi:hypothetical protein